MDQLARPRSLHAHVLRRYRLGDHPFLLSDAEFRLAIQAERQRVDRNGSVVSLLLIKLPEPAEDRPGLEFLAKLLEGRIRLTDTPGLLADGRVGILLPDTGAEGAWKVAEDISECFPPGPTRPECDVRLYPPKGRTDGFDKLAELPEEESIDRRQPPRTTHDDFLLAQPTPRFKRWIDVVGSLFGMTIAAPILAVAIVAIRLTSPGPVFFCQQREGLAGRRFKIYKLRTMSVDAEARKAELRAHSHQDGPAFKMHRDPRITPIGRFLRWSSIDELPQFFNVLRGDMSLVGPRPLPTDESEACLRWQRRRLDVAPGMTCFWQVSGRGDVSFDEWVRMDLQYIKEKGLWQDAKLIVSTVPSILFRRGIR